MNSVQPGPVAYNQAAQADCSVDFILVHFDLPDKANWRNERQSSARFYFNKEGRLYSVDWTQDWTRRKLSSSYLKARTQVIVERHYTAATIDNSLPSTQGLATQLSPCKQPAVVLPCITSSTLFWCEFVHENLIMTSWNTRQSLLAAKL